MLFTRLKVHDAAECLTFVDQWSVNLPRIWLISRVKRLPNTSRANSIIIVIISRLLTRVMAVAVLSRRVHDLRIYTQLLCD
jgi:hypothetical protein